MDPREEEEEEEDEAEDGNAIDAEVAEEDDAEAVEDADTPPDRPVLDAVRRERANPGTAAPGGGGTPCSTMCRVSASYCANPRAFHPRNALNETNKREERNALILSPPHSSLLPPPSSPLLSSPRPFLSPFRTPTFLSFLFSFSIFP